MTSRVPAESVAVRRTSHVPARVRLGARATWRSQVPGGGVDAQTGALDRCQALWQRWCSRTTRSTPPPVPWRHCC